jgi:hypothetical protein
LRAKGVFVKKFSLIFIALFALSAQAKEMLCVDFGSDGGFSATYNVGCSENFLSTRFAKDHITNVYATPGYRQKRMKEKALRDLAKFGITPLVEVGKEEHVQIYARNYDNSQPRDLCLMLIDSDKRQYDTRLIGCTNGTEISMTGDPSDLKSFGVEQLEKSGFRLTADIDTHKFYRYQIFSRKR